MDDLAKATTRLKTAKNIVYFGMKKSHPRFLIYRHSIGVLNWMIRNVETRELAITLVFRLFGKSGSVKESMNYVPDKFESDPLLDRCFLLLSSMTKSARKTSLLWRVAQESQECLDNGWYLIMDTLTIDPNKLESDRAILSGRGWHLYKQRFREAIRKALGYKQNCGIPQIEYLRYAAVVEWGETGNNPHLHVLWMLKDIPTNWKYDPNLSNVIPIRRELDNAKSAWEYGWSTPTAVRTSSDDPWARNGWTWPVDKQTHKPIPACGVSGPAAYIAKYLTKEEDKQWTTRVRISRNLGLNGIKAFLRKLETNLLRPLQEITRNQNWIKEYRHVTNCPGSLVAQLAKQERISRLWVSKQTRLIQLTMESPKKSIVSRLLTFIQGMDPQSSICTESLLDHVREDSTVSDSRAIKAYERLQREYPKRYFHPSSAQPGRSVYANL